MSAEKILIVEDDLDQTIGLSVRLRANGYQVFCAADGTTAFTQACKLCPDLIILDIGLPAGDGFKVLEWLGGMVATAVIPVVVLSGRDPSLARDRVLRMGVRAFFQKPAENDDLLSAIREILSTGQTFKKESRLAEEDVPASLKKPAWTTSMAERIERWRADLNATPGDTDLMNDIARVLATTSDPQLKNVEEAMRLVKKALSLMGAPTPTILDTLGIVYAAAGQFPQALEAARKGYALAKDNGQTAAALDLQERIRQYENNTLVTEDNH
jgi:DNA-binding response OmpR family regulator